MKKVYVIFKHTIYGINHETNEPIFESELVGVFTSHKLAKQAIKTQEALGKPDDSKEIVFEIEGMELNIMLMSEEEQKEYVSSALECLVKDGLVDYKIDEKGEFVFELTEKGKNYLGDKK